MYRFIVLIILLVCPSLLASDFRVFTGTDGRSIEAKIVRCDPRSGKVTVERTNRRKITVPVTVFSEADQDYIREWLSAQNFLSNAKLRISVKKKKGKRPDGPQTQKPKAPCHYEIVLDNRSGAELSGIEVQCRLFKKHKSLKGGDDKISTIADSSEVIQLADRAKHTFSTKVVKLYQYANVVTDTYIDSYGHTSYDTSYNKTAEDKLEGIRVRIVMTTPGGTRFVRELSDPSNLNETYGW